jgi:outer membrane usher protein
MRTSAIALASILWCSSSYAAESIYAISINGKAADEALLATTTEDGDLIVPGDKLTGYGLVGEFSALQSMKALGVTVEIQEEKQLVNLIVPGKLFKAQSFQHNKRIGTPDPMPKGVLINQDIAVSKGFTGLISTSWGYDMRTGLLGGVLVNTGQVNFVSGEASNTRGLTTWTRDFLNNGTSLQVGDVFTNTNGLVSTSNLLGFKFGTERELTGDLFNVPMIAGVADSRSTAELYINDQKQRQYQLETGPYSIAQQSTSNGLNSSSIVLRDQFGREQVINQSFYFSNQSLRPGASEWSVALGKSRFGSIGNDYQDLAFSGSYRRGINPYFTVGTTSQWMDGNANVGLNGIVILGTMGVLNLNTIASQKDGKTDYSYSAGYSYQDRNWSVNLQTQKRGQDTWQLNDQWRGGTIIEKSNLASLSYSHRPFQVGAAYATNTYSNGFKTERVSLSARFADAKNSLSAQIYQQNDDRGFNVFYTRQLGRKQRVSLGYSDQNQSVGMSGRLGRLNYGLATSSTITTANASLDTNKGRFQAQSFMRDGASSTNGRYEGSMWLGEGGLVVQKRINRSFALIEVQDSPGAVVNANGAVLKTNRSGFALMQVPAYSPIRVALDVNSLPFEAQVGSKFTSTTAPRSFGSKGQIAVSYDQPLEFRAIQGGKIITGPGVAELDSVEVPIADDGRIYFSAFVSESIVSIQSGDQFCQIILPKKIDNEVQEFQCK